MKKTNEYQGFTKLMGKLLTVPHSEIKAKLDAENRAKKRKKSKPPSASRVASARG